MVIIPTEMLMDQIKDFRKESVEHLTNELLPFWLNRIKDEKQGGVITHFDEKGNDSGECQEHVN